MNGVVRGRTEWNNAEQGHLLMLPDIPAAALAAGRSSSPIRVPPASRATGQDSLVDVSLLNWIEVDYPRVATAPARQARLYAAEPAPVRSAGRGRGGAEAVAAHAAGRGTRAKAFVVYGDDGSRWESRSLGRAGAGAGGGALGGRRQGPPLRRRGRGRPAAPARRRSATSPRGLKTRAAPGRLRDGRPRAPARGASSPWPTSTARRGLKVEVVDIQDVYDEFNHGILHPRALRDFLSHAYHQWQRPAPALRAAGGRRVAGTPRTRRRDEEHYPAATFSPGHGTAVRGHRRHPLRARAPSSTTAT